MSEFSRNFPCDLERIEELERRGRENILRHYPGTIDGIALNRLDELLHHTEGLRLHLSGIARSPAGIPSDCVPVALCARGGVGGRCVLGLSIDLSIAIVHRTLGRDERPNTATPFMNDRLFPGEKGALMFALDAAAGDWICAGGKPFWIRGVLYDGDQVQDYLGGPPNWSVMGQLVGPGVKGQLWLWFRDPVPVISRFAHASIGGRALLWSSVVCLNVGYADLSTEDVAQLAVADRIVLDGWNHPLSRGGREHPLFISGNWHRFGRWLDNQRIQVISMSERVEEMAKESEQNEIAALLEPVDGDEEGEMTVTVSVEVGSFRTAVRQAAALLPGRILCLDKPVGPEVTLKVQGKVIGRGILIEHEGSLAVEVKDVR